MKRILTTLLTILVFTSLPAFAQNTPDYAEEVKAIKTLIREYYWNVMYTNDERKEISEMANGFHQDFHMYVYYENEVSVSTRDEWMGFMQANRDKAKDKPSNRPKNTNSLAFGFVDVTGQTAAAKLLISSNGKLKYTDYFTLYKIDGEWKVMSKLFTFHQL